MGMNGDEYDDWAGDFTPNKDRRMEEWRAKKKKENDDAKKRQIDRYYDQLNGRAPKIEYGTGRNVDFSKGLNIKKSPNNRPSREPEPPQPGLFD